MWSEPILHVDMDAFFVEVERLDDPSLVGIPVAVGGAGRRGVIASASYEARPYGVSSAQPTQVALRLCPRLRLVPARHGRYREMSNRVFEVFRSFTDRVEGLSLDEAFLDVRGLSRHHPSPVAVGEAIRTRIRDELGLPSSVGVGSSKLMAKLASESAKPDGLRHVPRAGELGFLHPLPVQRLWGVGPATLAGLHRLGVETVGDLAEVPEATLVAGFGPSHGRQLLGLARGHDPRPVIPDSEARSLSVEETYPEDLEGRASAESALLELAHRLSGRLHRAGMTARTVGLKVRSPDFATVSRQLTLQTPTDRSEDLHGTAVSLLARSGRSGPIRLLGLVASNLEPRDRPLQLTLGDRPGEDRLDQALAGIEERFGGGSVRRARTLGGRAPGGDGDR